MKNTKKRIKQQQYEKAKEIVLAYEFQNTPTFEKGSFSIKDLNVFLSHEALNSL